MQLRFVKVEALKALFNNVFTFKKSELHVPACYQLVFAKVYKWSPEKIAPQKHH